MQVASMGNYDAFPTTVISASGQKAAGKSNLRRAYWGKTYVHCIQQQTGLQPTALHPKHSFMHNSKLPVQACYCKVPTRRVVT